MRLSVKNISEIVDNIKKLYNFEAFEQINFIYNKMDSVFFYNFMTYLETNYYSYGRNLELLNYFKKLNNLTLKRKFKAKIYNEKIKKEHTEQEKETKKYICKLKYKEIKKTAKRGQKNEL